MHPDVKIGQDIFLVLMSLSGGVFQALAGLAQLQIPLEIVGFLAGRYALGKTPKNPGCLTCVAKKSFIISTSG